MKTLLLKDGDLALSGRRPLEVSGTRKVMQDLRGALYEPLGNDRFHGGWGSNLDQYIATIADEDTRFAVEAEVNRVISNYASIQRDKVEADIHSDSESRFSTDEIISRILGVTTNVYGDTISVEIAIQTASGEVVVLNGSGA